MERCLGEANRAIAEMARQRQEIERLPAEVQARGQEHIASLGVERDRVLALAISAVVEAPLWEREQLELTIRLLGRGIQVCTHFFDAISTPPPPLDYRSDEEEEEHPPVNRFLPIFGD